MDAEPLSKEIYDKAKSIGVTAIRLEFQSGIYEGYLTVVLEYGGKHQLDDDEFVRQIDDWAWEVYDYPGAGEEVAYGDIVVYDLMNNQVVVEEWHHEIVSSKSKPVALQLAEPEDEDEE
jgi:hypothetical protein